MKKSKKKWKHDLSIGNRSAWTANRSARTRRFQGWSKLRWGLPCQYHPHLKWKGPRSKSTSSL